MVDVNGDSAVVVYLFYKKAKNYFYVSKRQKYKLNISYVLSIEKISYLCLDLHLATQSVHSIPMIKLYL